MPAPVRSNVRMRRPDARCTKVNRGLETNGGIHQHLCRLLAIVTAGNGVQRPRRLDVEIHIPGEIEAQPTADRFKVRDRRWIGRAIVVPRPGTLEERVRLDRAEDGILRVHIVTELERAAETVIAGDRAGIVAAADLCAAKSDLLAGDKRREGELALKGDDVTQLAEQRLLHAGDAGDLGKVHQTVWPRQA